MSVENKSGLVARPGGSLSTPSNVGETTEGETVDDDSNLCKVCFENKVDSVILECGHSISCFSCGRSLRICPICRRPITRVIRIFRS